MLNSEEKEIEFISKLSDNKEYYKNLLENSKKIPEIINERKEKIEKINLFENFKTNLYEWKNLFSPSISIKKYTKLKNENESKKNLILKRSNSEKKNISKKDNFQFPIALIDLPEEKLENIITNYKKINNKINNK